MLEETKLTSFLIGTTSFCLPSILSLISEQSNRCFSDVCRRERTTNFEHKFDPSVVKFSNEKYSGLFATLCKTEMIEVNQLVPTLNEETLTQSYSVRRLLAENNRPISHSRYVNDIAWSNKGNKLASVCKDSNLKVWSVTEDSIKLVNRFNTVSQASFVRWDTKVGTYETSI